jgi:hypothetical protein
MSVGWVWVAATALIPYFLIGRGRGRGSIEIFGIARTEWLAFHVWSSIAIGLLTIGHVVLNRRGLTRSYRVVAGASARSEPGKPSRRQEHRGLTWLVAVAVLTVAIAGSWVYAATAADPVGGGWGRNEAVQSVEMDSGGGEDSQIRVPRSGNGYRGGRGGG